MIFSEERWESDREGMDYIKASKALTWNGIKAPLKNAFELFLSPLLGSDMIKTLVGIYKSYPSGNTDESKRNLKLLNLSQRANILLALWYDYDEMNVLLGDGGFKRQESDAAKIPYKYQEKNLKTGWKNKGFDALDDMLKYLEDNIKFYAEYEKSNNYVFNKSAIVRNTSDVNDSYFINQSRLVFLRLKPHFRIVEDTIIAPRLGLGLYEDLKENLKSDEPGKKYMSLRDYLRPVIIYYAVQRLILETGNLTDKGLFFSSLRGGDDSEESNSPVSDERTVYQAKQAESDAIAYWQIAERFLKKEFGITPSFGATTHRRDNTGKKAFWT